MRKIYLASLSAGALRYKYEQNYGRYEQNYSRDNDKNCFCRGLISKAR